MTISSKDLHTADFTRLYYVQGHVPFEDFLDALEERLGCSCCFQMYREPEHTWGYIVQGGFQRCNENEAQWSFPVTLVEKKR